MSANVKDMARPGDRCPRAEAVFQLTREVVGRFMVDEADRAELVDAFALLKVAVEHRKVPLAPAPVHRSRRAYRMPK